MILRFGCENYRSIKDYQEILFTSSGKQSSESSGIITNDAIREKIVPVTAIYGANASGKSNLILAMRFLVRAVVLSASTKRTNIKVNKFKIGDEYLTRDSTFDIDFIVKNVHYHYGFKIGGGYITEEWLYSFSYVQRMSRTVLFYRKKGDEPYFGKTLKGNNKVIYDVTNDSTLYLSQAAFSNHEMLNDIYSYFKENFSFRLNASFDEDSIGEMIVERNLADKIKSFMSRIDAGITSISVEKNSTDIKERELAEKLRSSIMQFFSEDGIISETEFREHKHEIYIHREDLEGKEYKFRFGEESLGTKSLISLLTTVFYVIKNGGVFVVDEIESSLHSLLAIKVVELFMKSSANARHSQLIFSTHDTMLLNSKGLFKDEIWFTEKSILGGTNLFPLSDYNVKSSSNIRKGYLDGKFGAIPFLNNLDDFCIFSEE